MNESRRRAVDGEWTSTVIILGALRQELEVLLNRKVDVDFVYILWIHGRIKTHQE